MFYLLNVTLTLWFILFAPLSSGTVTQLPGGNWTEASHPVWMKDASVNVAAVTTRADQGLTISSTQVKNLSTKSITAVKLAWYIFSEQKGATILRSGRTPLLAIPKGIPPQGVATIDYSVVSFANEATALEPSGALTKNYHVAVVVTFAPFDDGTTYNPDADTFAINWFRWFLDATDFGQVGGDCPSCQNQNCVWSGGRNCYVCQAGPCEMCSVANCNSCTNSHCDR
jgi:hypothetical protein